ncbi:signal peptidase II [Bowdeniella nasicola]|uniref:Lipoprotein signal peptidase n=1 Tax=Bowdeniella nasicola TaxID=208480 RepID=A0A1H4B906_9ACTO|nr:signal peptidase II [Bowdeniella nasicola]
MTSRPRLRPCPDTPLHNGGTVERAAVVHVQNGTELVQRERAPRAAFGIGMAIALACLAIDQATKIWALSALEPGVYHPVLGRAFGLTLVFNSGAAFSFGSGATWIFTIVAAACVICATYALTRITHPAWIIVVAVLLGGSAGNLIDRIFRAPGTFQGHVVDFLSYSNWFVGNVADIFIVGAAIALAILSFTSDPRPGRKLLTDDGTAFDDEEAAGS